MSKIDEVRSDRMSGCTLCPRMCGADRENGKTGFCGETGEIRAARAALHMWEEPCISGKEGSGTVFFTGCTLRCVFCQNHEIAGSKVGKVISEEWLAEIFLELQVKGANNINLVTPTHFVPQTIQHFQSFHSLVTACIINNRQIHPLLLRTLKRPDDLREARLAK